MVTFLTPDYLLIFETGARLFLIGKTLCKIYKFTTPTEQNAYYHNFPS